MTKRIAQRFQSLLVEKARSQNIFSHETPTESIDKAHLALPTMHMRKTPFLASLLLLRLLQRVRIELHLALQPLHPGLAAEAALCPLQQLLHFLIAWLLVEFCQQLRLARRTDCMNAPFPWVASQQPACITTSVRLPRWQPARITMSSRRTTL
jgi:hypothetical protein